MATKRNVSINDALAALGEDFSFDPTKGITTKSGTYNFNVGSYSQGGDGEYYLSDPGALGALIAAGKADPFDQSYMDAATKQFDPIRQANDARYKTGLESIVANQESGIAKAEGVYDEGIVKMGSDKANSLDTLRAQMGTRNTTTSGPGTTAVRKLEEWATTQNRLLEQSKAGTIADLIKSSDLSRTNLENERSAQDAQLGLDIYNMADQNYKTHIAQDETSRSNYAKYLLGLEDLNESDAAAEREAERRRQEDATNFERQKQLTAMSKSSGGSKSSGTTEAQIRSKINSEAIELAKNDDRLKSALNPNGGFTFAQLVDAWTVKLETDYGLRKPDWQSWIDYRDGNKAQSPSYSASKLFNSNQW